MKKPKKPSTPLDPMDGSLLGEVKKANAANAVRYYECTHLLCGFYNNDFEKVALWMDSRNPFLGDISPNNLFALGRGHKVLKFIKACLEVNKPPMKPKKPVKPKPHAFAYIGEEAEGKCLKIAKLELYNPAVIRRFAAWLLKAASWIEFNQQRKGKK